MLMKRNGWLLICIILVGLMIVTGCGQKEAATATEPAAEESQYTAENPLVLRIGFLNAPNDSSCMSGQKWSEMLKEKSGGRIDLQVFPSGELGSNREAYQAMQDGTIDMWSMIPGTIAGFDPRYELSSLPGLFKNLDQAVQFDRNGFIGQELDKYFEENGLIRLVKGEPNFYNFYTTEKAGPIGSVAEMKGMKLRIPESPMLKVFFENAKAVPTPMPWGEIYTSLQRNVIDGTVGNMVWSVAAKFHEVATNIDRVNVQYTPSDWFMSKKTWEKMPKDLQDIITASIPEIQAYAQESWDKEVAKNIADLTEQGVKIIEPTAEQQAQWSKECFVLWKDYAVTVWGEDMVKRMETEIINAQ